MTFFKAKIFLHAVNTNKCKLRQVTASLILKKLYAGIRNLWQREYLYAAWLPVNSVNVTFQKPLKCELQQHVLSNKLEKKKDNEYLPDQSQL